MKKKARYIVILVILAVYFLLMYFLIGRDNLKKETLESKILVGKNTVWELKNKKWSNITNASDRKKLNWQEFQVYIANKSAGSYYLWHDDKWYLFDKEKNAINYSGSILAIQSNYDIDVQEFESTEISDFTYPNQVLVQNGLNTTQEYTVKSVVSYDIDNDNIQESFYSISNAFSGGTAEKVFSMVFMVKNEQIISLYNSVDTNTGTNGCKPYINTILDANNDGKNEIILTCGNYSIEEPIQMLYHLDKNEFKILVSNQ